MTVIALGLTHSSRAANLVWNPTNANWNQTTWNWMDTNSHARVVFAPGDNVRFDDKGGLHDVTLIGSLSPSSVLVDSIFPYSFVGVMGTLAGGLPLVKRGPGLLILDANNSISGPTSIEGGQLQIGNGISRGSLGSGPITNSTGLIINRTGTLNITNYLSGSGGFTNKLDVTVNIWGTNTMSGPILIQIGHLSLSNAPAQGDSKTIILDASTGGTANPRLGLTGGINLPSDATLSLLGTASAGPTRCTVQTVLGSDPTTNSVNGSILVGSGDGLIEMNAISTGTGLLEINGNISNHPDNATPFSGTFYLRGAGNGILSGTVTLPEASLVKTDAGTFTVASTGNSWAGILVAVGRLRLGIDDALPNNVPFSMGQATGTNAIFDLNGFNQQLGTLSSVEYANIPIIANSSTTSDSVLSLADGGAYAGLIQDSISNGTHKVGLTILSGAPNPQQLSRVCTYSGPTTLQGGGRLSLVGSGSIPNSTPIELASGAFIDVRSKSDSTLTVQSTQTLRGDGTFFVNGNLASQGTIELKLNKSGDTLTNDKIGIIGLEYQITYGGTLKLDLSGDPLDSTDTFQLFDAGPGQYAGAFSSIVPSTPGPGLAWNTSSLTTDGTLKIDVNIPTTPINITFAVVSGGTELEVAWPEAYKGWTLQGQTNALSVGITTTWHDVPDSAATNRVYLPIDPANGSVFHRLRYQP